MHNRTHQTKRLVLLAMLAAISYLILYFVRIPVVLFLKYEPKDVVITIGGFLFGPMAAFAVSLVVSLVEMFTISETGIIGCLMNLLSTCSFACPAALLYRRRHDLKGAVLGLALGAVAMVAAMLAWNWLITPWYMDLPRQEVQALLILAFLPFNLLKAGLNSALVLCLYKPLTSALRKARLLPERTGPSGDPKPGIYLFAGLLLLTCVLFLLALQGKL